MMTNLTEWASEHGQITKIWFQTAAEVKLFELPVQFGYDAPCNSRFLGKYQLFKLEPVLASARPVRCGTVQARAGDKAWKKSRYFKS